MLIDIILHLVIPDNKDKITNLEWSIEGRVGENKFVPCEFT